MSVARFIKNQEIVETVKDQWVRVFGLLSHPGKRRHGIYNEFDQRYGSDNWIPAHYCDGKLISRYDGYLMYEEGYYQFLKSNPGIREWIINTASDVYDIDPSNVNSGLEYTAQEYEVTHLQEIASVGFLPDLSWKRKDSHMIKRICRRSQYSREITLSTSETSIQKDIFLIQALFFSIDLSLVSTRT